jgi:hypothetical protein
VSLANPPEPLYIQAHIHESRVRDLCLGLGEAQAWRGDGVVIGGGDSWDGCFVIVGGRRGKLFPVPVGSLTVLPLLQAWCGDGVLVIGAERATSSRSVIIGSRRGAEEAWRRYGVVVSSSPADRVC